MAQVREVAESLGDLPAEVRDQVLAMRERAPHLSQQAQIPRPRGWLTRWGKVRCESCAGN